MTLKRYQSGASLLVSLIMLLVLTILVVSAIRSSSTNLKIAGNMQAQTEATAAAQQAIEQVMSSDAIFKTPAGQTIVVGPYSVTVGTPVCIRKKPVDSGGSADPNPNMLQDGLPGGGAAGEILDTYWDIPATVLDTAATGVKVEVHQGVRIMLPAILNPCS